MLSQIIQENECVRCGACCAFFRVSFYWAEGEQMPAQYVEALTPIYSCMQGTNQKQPRCGALAGEIGQQVGCSIYETRSSSCKEVQMGDAQCNKARAAHKMIPIIPVEPAYAENDEDFERVI